MQHSCVSALKNYTQYHSIYNKIYHAIKLLTIKINPPTL